MHEISRIIIGSYTDSPQVFRLAFRSAQLAGLLPTDQIKYACIVVDRFFISHCREDQLIFRIGHNQRDQPVLRVELENAGHSFETMIPAVPPLFDHINDLPGEPAPRSNEPEASTSMISYQLKNSLTKLKLAASLLETDDDPSSIQQHMDIVQRSAAQLGHTLNDLNKIMQINHGFPEIKPLTLSTVFSKVCEALHEKIIMTEASINTDFGGISGWMYAEMYLQNIFSNLLINSLKYQYANRRPEIVIKAIKQANDVQLVFSDNGMGIDPDQYQKKLFMPFSQFSSDKQEGKGLGLYIVKSIIERNGGTICVDSQPGKGTVFTMLLRAY